MRKSGCYGCRDFQGVGRELGRKLFPSPLLTSSYGVLYSCKGWWVLKGRNPAPPQEQCYNGKFSMAVIANMHFLQSFRSSEPEAACCTGKSFHRACWPKSQAQ